MSEISWRASGRAASGAGLEPNSEVGRDDFLNAAMGADFPDEIVLQVDSSDPDPEHTFSQEGVNEIAEQFRTFLMARIIGHRERTGRMPKRVRATVNLDWAPPIAPKDDPDVGPFYYIRDDKGLEPIDATKRYKWRNS